MRQIVPSLVRIGNDDVAESPKAQRYLDRYVSEAILTSFNERPMAGTMTRAEVVSRFNQVEEMVKIARFDCKMSPYRIADHLLHWLLLWLDENTWEPDLRRKAYGPHVLRPRHDELVGPDGRPLH